MTYSIGGTNILFLESAFAIASFVWVAGFGINTFVDFDVLKSVVHQATIATHVTEFAGAIDQVLFREGNELFGLAEVLTFERTSGGESPARSTLALIFDWGDISVLAPV